MTTVTVTASGQHTLRIQVREDGVQLDQIVFTRAAYLTAASGGLIEDTTIVKR